MMIGLSSIAILGPGGIGGFLSAIFEKTGFSVTCVAKPERVEEIRTNGIHLTSSMFGTFTTYPRAVDFLDIKPRILFITTKAVNLDDALARIDPDGVSEAVIIPLLNGIEHIEALRKRFSRHTVVAGTMSIEAYESAPGHVIHPTLFARIRLAVDDSLLKEQLQDVAVLIRRTGITAEIGASESQILWEKLVRLNALALITSRYKKPIGELRNDEHIRQDISALVKEAVIVAKEESAVIDEADVMAHIDRLEPGQFSSLKRDIDMGKESELDAIAGAIVRAGMRRHISCPVISRYISEITSDARTNM